MLMAGDTLLDQFPLLTACLEAIAAREADVRAFTEDGRDETVLLGEARALLERWPDPGARPPLFGVPLGVKDIFRADGYSIRAGSRLPAVEFDGPEASAVTRLKVAGALVMGITVSAEFACWAPGPTRNPRNLAHTPGGSSSGSAAGVAAGFFPLALGSQTAGSVIRPAAYCGVVGVKPGFGRIDRAGLVPYSASLDHVGLFADGIDRAELALAALCDGWHPAPPPLPGDLVLGVPTGPYVERASARGRKFFARAIAWLRQAGFGVCETPLFEDVEELCDDLRRLARVEVAEVHRDWVAGHGDLYHPSTLSEIRAGQASAPGTAQRLRQVQHQARRRTTAITRAAGVDLWLSPAAPDRAPAGLEATGDPVLNSPWSFIGWPALCLPCGVDADGLPYGLQLAVPSGRDEALLAAARTIERHAAGDRERLA